MSHFPIIHARERYAKMGFPKNYKVTISAEHIVGDFSVGEHWIHLYQWRQTYSRFRNRPLGYRWVQIRSKMISIISSWDDIDADGIAASWLYDIKADAELREDSE